MKKVLAILLAVLLAFSALTVAAFAAAGDTVDEAIAVTGNFTANMKRDKDAYYKFVPAQSGFYSISSATTSFDPVAELLSDNGKRLQHNDDGSDGLNFEMRCYLAEGKTYYIKIWLLDDVSSGAVNVRIEFRGAVTSVEVVSYPEAREYILDYDCYPNDGDVPYSYSGLKVMITVAGGNPMVLWGDEARQIFELEYSEPAVGTNAVVFKLGDEVIFTWYTEVIENPVASIAVTRLPNKVNYVYRIDGDYYGAFGNKTFYPYIWRDGLEIKISYTDGTSETFAYGENFWGYFGDYYVEIACGACGIGQNDVTVSYLGRGATFKINVVKPSFAQRFFFFLTDVADFFSLIHNVKGIGWNDISRWLRGQV